MLGLTLRHNAAPPFISVFCGIANIPLLSFRLAPEVLKMVGIPIDLNQAGKEEIIEFLNSFDTVFTDCDGVLWLENDVIKDSDKVLNAFRRLGKNVYYVTNNSTKTREEFVIKCEKLGFIAKWEEIVNTAYLVAEYLHGISFKKKVYVIGNYGITKELDRFGIRHTNIGPDVLDVGLGEYLRVKMSSEIDPEVGAVVIGFDEHFSYPKMLKAVNYLKNPDCLFLATNSDENFPLNNLLLPGTGSFVKCLETAVGRKAYYVGKPNEYIREAVTKNYKVNPSRTLMIGDKCNTDILFGKRCGFKTLLVLSGVTSYEEIISFASSAEASDHDLVPQYCLKKLGDLLCFMS